MSPELKFFLLCAFFAGLLALAILWWWLSHTTYMRWKNGLLGLGATLFGLLLIWRSIEAITSGIIKTSRIANGTYTLQTDPIMYWSLTAIFALFGVIALIVGIRTCAEFFDVKKNLDKP